ncbi:MAG: hypothetical protein Q8L14_32325 [Myxococcales bacterium]|nr:hypothetical protein [Myxococcales bacterium]
MAQALAATNDAGGCGYADGGAISAQVLRGSGFVRSARSTLLPSLDLRRLAKLASMEDQSKAVRAFLKLKV